MRAAKGEVEIEQLAAAAETTFLPVANGGGVHDPNRVRVRRQHRELILDRHSLNRPIAKATGVSVQEAVHDW